MVNTIKIDPIPSGGKDCDATEMVRNILNRKISGPSRIVFTPGRYDFWPDRACEEYLFISNNDPGLKRIAFPLIGCEDLEIDGQGAEFVFHGRMIPFVVKNCRNVRLTGFSIDWERTFHDEATVLEADADGVVLEFAEKFPYRVEGRRLIHVGEGYESGDIRNALEFDPSKMETAFRVNDNFGIGRRHSAREIRPGVVRFDAPLTDMPQVGNRLTLTQNSRHHPAIVLTHSAGSVLDDVSIYHAGGMGIIGQRCEDITVRNSRVMVRPGSGRVVSTTADATHFVNCRGHILLDGCRFENQLDDATNVHGIYSRITRIIDDSTLEAKIVHFQQWGQEIAAAGDRMEFANRNTLLGYHEAVASSVEWLNQEYSLLSFSSPMPADLQPGDALLNVDWSPDLTVRNCTAARNRARGFLVSTAGKVLIENNHFHVPGAAILVEGDLNHWFEAGPVRDVTIRNNRFANCLYGVWGQALVQVSPRIQAKNRVSPRYHRNIVFEDNQIECFDQRLINAHSVDGLTFRGNEITHTQEYPRPDSEVECFVITDCCNVHVETPSPASEPTAAASKETADLT